MSLTKCKLEEESNLDLKIASQDKITKRVASASDIIRLEMPIEV